MRILGILLILAGGGMIGGAMYIKNEVAQGRMQIADAEKKVNMGKSLFSLDPNAKKVGDQLFSPIDKKLNEAKGEAGYYAQLAARLQIGGIISLVVGAVLLFFSKKKRRS